MPARLLLPFSAQRVICCGLAGVLLLLSGCAAHRVQPQGLRVLVYNIHAGADAAGANNLDRVGAIIRNTNADIVLLQEVDRGVGRSGRVDEVKEIERRTGLHGVLGKTLDYQGGDYGIATFSRWPILTSDLRHLPVTPVQTRAGGSHEPRGALVLTTKAGKWMLTVINTHLDPSREDIYRLQEADEVLKLAADIEFSNGEGRSPSAVLIGGDFNSELDSAVQHKVHAQLHDLWEDCGAGQELTYPADVPRKRIDYLFSTAKVECLSATVLDTQASDHRPVLFTLRLK